MIIRRQLPGLVGALATFLAVETLPVANAQDLAKISKPTINQRETLEAFHEDQGQQHPPVLFALSPIDSAPVKKIPAKFAELIKMNVWEAKGNGIEAQQLIDTANMLNSRLHFMAGKDSAEKFALCSELVRSNELEDFFIKMGKIKIEPSENPIFNNLMKVFNACGLEKKLLVDVLNTDYQEILPILRNVLGLIEKRDGSERLLLVRIPKVILKKAK